MRVQEQLSQYNKENFMQQNLITIKSRKSIDILINDIETKL